MAGVGTVVAVALSRDDDVQRSAVFFHGADLHGRGVRAQYGSRVDVERVPIVAGRVALRNVERVEIVIGGFNFRPTLNAESEIESGPEIESTYYNFDALN